MSEPRNCRHCTNMVCGDANYCEYTGDTYSDWYIRAHRDCPGFEFNPIDALTLENPKHDIAMAEKRERELYERRMGGRLVMSEIKALEKLRNTIVTYAADCDERWMLAACDDIEAEITERYMLLPVDADGVPIRVGDVVVAISTGESETVTHVSDKSYVVERTGIKPSSVRHAKPRTLEDVLRDVWKEALDYAKSDIWRNPDEVFAERAKEIRELLLGGDE